MWTTYADFSNSEFNKHQNYVEILQGMSLFYLTQIKLTSDTWKKEH